MKKTVPFLLLIILFAVAAWYSFISGPDPVHEILPPQLAPAAPVTRNEPQPAQDEGVEDYIEPEPVIDPDPLPPLDQSDAEIRQALADLVGTDSLAEYLVKSQTISRLVATIDSLTSRQIPPQINPVKAAGGKFVVDTEGETVVMSTQNFSRYDGYIALMQSADTDALMAIYQRYAPLFQIAWEENGGQGQFNDRLHEVIDHLLDTPIVSDPVYLTTYEAVYLFEEPELEAMTAGQKILLRMGSVNAELVKEKLTEIREKL